MNNHKFKPSHLSMKTTTIRSALLLSVTGLLAAVAPLGANQNQYDGFEVAAHEWERERGHRSWNQPRHRSSNRRELAIAADRFEREAERLFAITHAQSRRGNRREARAITRFDSLAEKADHFSDLADRRTDRAHLRSDFDGVMYAWRRAQDAYRGLRAPVDVARQYRRTASAMRDLEILASRY